MKRLVGCTDDEFRKAVRESASIAEVFRSLGTSLSGGSYKSFRVRVGRLGCDISHFYGKGWLRGSSTTPQYKRSLEEVLILGSEQKSTPGLKKRLIREGMLEEKCVICGLGPIWNSRRLVLQIDHVNGDRTDNRIENLRILCPNCHTQTPTFTGRNQHQGKKLGRNQRRTKKITRCVDCGIMISRNAIRCKSCARGDDAQERLTVDWPTDIALRAALRDRTAFSLAREIGVSYNGLKKRLASCGIKYVRRDGASPEYTKKQIEHGNV